MRLNKIIVSIFFLLIAKNIFCQDTSYVTIKVDGKQKKIGSNSRYYICFDSLIIAGSLLGSKNEGLLILNRKIPEYVNFVFWYGKYEWVLPNFAFISGKFEIELNLETKDLKTKGFDPTTIDYITFAKIFPALKRDNNEIVENSQDAPVYSILKTKMRAHFKQK